MEIKLLKILSASENGLSIAALSKKLKCNSLKVLEFIAEINQIQPKLLINHSGKYCLNEKLEWLDGNIIGNYLSSHELNYHLVLLDQLESTNNYALNHINNLPDRSLISCDWQYNGRGRFGRHWLSTIAHDLTVSIVRIFPGNFNLGILPLLCAVAINRLLKDYQIQNKIKWPNDIYVDSNKVAGILVENLVRQQQNHTVIGIGIDNFANFPRNKILGDLVIALENLLAECELFGFALLRREWLDNCWHLNQPMTICQNGDEICQGIHRDIGENGELILETNTGLEKFSSSAISIKFTALESMS